jgi:hypothetical protein
MEAAMLTYHRKSTRITVIIATLLFFLNVPVFAQGPEGKDFGFGIVVGDPFGVTAKYWTTSNQAVVGSIGASHFGDPRLNIDYLWHFDAFNSDIAKLYAGAGMPIGFDNRVGARMMMGGNVIPRQTPLEIFLEMGPLFGLTPHSATYFDVAAGLRFYP